MPMKKQQILPRIMPALVVGLCVIIFSIAWLFESKNNKQDKTAEDYQVTAQTTTTVNGETDSDNQNVATNQDANALSDQLQTIGEDVIANTDVETNIESLVDDVMEEQDAVVTVVVETVQGTSDSIQETVDGQESTGADSSATVTVLVETTPTANDTDEAENASDQESSDEQEEASESENTSDQENSDEEDGSELESSDEQENTTDQENSDEQEDSSQSESANDESGDEQEDNSELESTSDQESSDEQENTSGQEDSDEQEDNSESEDASEQDDTEADSSTDAADRGLNDIDTEEMAGDPVSDDIAKQILSLIKQARPDLPVDNVRFSNIEGIYKATLQDSTVFFSGDGEFFIVGDMYQVKGQQLINVEQQEEQRKLEREFVTQRARLLAATPIEDMVIFPAIGDNKAHIYIFTDIDCGFCRKLHHQVPEMQVEGIEVRYLAFPRAGLDSEAGRKLTHVWCADNRRRTMTELKQGKVLDTAPCETNAIVNNYTLAQHIGVSNAPTIVLESGQMVFGTPNTEQLINIIKEANLYD